MLKLENSIRGLSFSRVAFDLTIQATKLFSTKGRKGETESGSDFGLWPSQGQSRFLDPIHFSTYLSNIFRARFLCILH